MQGNTTFILVAAILQVGSYAYYAILIGGFLFLLVVIFLLIRAFPVRSTARARQNEAQYQKLIDEARMVMYRTDFYGDFTFITNWAYQLTGYSKEDLIGKNYSILVAPESLSEVSAHYRRQIESNSKESTLEFPIVLKDGSRKWVLQMAVLLHDENNKIAGFQCIVKDISEQKQLELEMQKLEKQRKKDQLLLQAILDNSPTLIFAKDVQGRYLLVNKKFEKIFKLNGRSVIGKDDYAFNIPELAQKYEEDDQWVITNREVKRVVQTLNTPAGPKDYMVLKFPIFNDVDGITGLCGLAYDISEQVLRQKELESARQIAENAEKAQEHFLANVSHEMRTPLNGIMGMNNLLASTALNDEQTEFVAAIKETSESLLILINDLLDMSKIKAGKLTFEKIDFDVRKLCSSAFASLQYQANEKKLEFITHIDPDLPPVLTGDSYRLRQILVNLASNAVKFTQTGFVKLSVFVEEKTEKTILVRFEVEDTGIGIPKEKMNGLFKEFTQIGEDISRRYGGTGLGLAITQQLVKMQKGKIKVSSEQGKGSTFTVIILYGFKNTPVKEEPVKELNIRTVSQVFNNRCILLVEDNIINQKVVAHPLYKAGAWVVIAANGKEAITQLQKGLRPNLILMDLGMPVMDGYEATAYIRKKIDPDVPIVAMTASSMPGEKEKCIEYGMNGYISKPLSIKSLFNLMYPILSDSSENTIEHKNEKINNDPKARKEHYNLSYLDEMEDNEYSREILIRFLQDAPGFLEQLDKDTRKNKWPDVYKNAHKFKSSLGLLKMQPMLDYIAPIEQKARDQQDVEEIPTLLLKAQAEYKIASKLLEREIMRLTNET